MGGNKNPTQGRGRRKRDEIKKIEEPNKLQVAFSKRKAGLFSKITQLSTLTGAAVAIITFSPQGYKVYSSGYPNADAVIDHYLAGQPQLLPSASMDITEAAKLLEMEKKKGEMIEDEKKKNEMDGGDWLWWEKGSSDDIQGMELDEVEEYVEGLHEFRMNVLLRIQELCGGCSSSGNGVYN